MLVQYLYQLYLQVWVVKTAAFQTNRKFLIFNQNFSIWGTWWLFTHNSSNCWPSFSEWPLQVRWSPEIQRRIFNRVFWDFTSTAGSQKRLPKRKRGTILKIFTLVWTRRGSEGKWQIGITEHKVGALIGPSKLHTHTFYITVPCWGVAVLLLGCKVGSK